MKRKQTPRPDRRALHAAGGAWWPRLRSLTLILLALLALSSGILGYRISQGESLRLNEGTAGNRFVTFSLKPVETETASFDRVSLSLRPMQDGELMFDSAVELLLDGVAVAHAQSAPLLFTGLVQGSYTLRVTLPAIKRAFGVDPAQTAETILRVRKSQV